MQTFTIGLGRYWWMRALGRNPLVRRSDRVEALAVALAIVIAVVATPIAGAIGTSVHDARTLFYAEEAENRHQVTATAIENGSVVVPRDSVSFSGRAKWSIAGSEHIGAIEWPDQAKVGEQQDIWVDSQGEPVGPPPPPSRADTDAVAIALTVWFGVAAAAAGFVYVLRRQLDRRRYADWDREIDASADDGGRTDKQS